MPFATRRGCRLFWERDGRAGAPSLLLVRGLTRSSRYWGELREHLAASFHLLVTDNRGSGQSDATWPPYSTKGMADDHAAVLDAAGEARVHVFGISLGGMISQHIALRHAARVNRLILGCTTAGGRSAVRIPRNAVIDLVRAGVGPIDRATRKIASRLLSEETIRQRPEVVEQWIAIALGEPRRRKGFLGQILAAGQHDAYRDLPRIAAPTLVLTGDADRLIPPENSRILADRVPGARLRFIPGAGHDFPTDRPEETAAAIREFLLA
jgi:pimeloyl-ACP methyl ester carboxylesterase